MVDLHSPSDWLRTIARNAKRLLVFIVGVAVLAAGVAMLALPGPGVVVIIVGLVILATEFAWAERMLDKTTEKAAGAATKVTGNKSGQLALAASGVGMIIGGIVIAVVSSTFLAVGISLTIAGGIGLCTLLPQVQAWIDEKAAKTAD
jgi:uncharacterized protein (TIGR02611 family)